MSSGEREGGFLSRWAKRKAEVKQEEQREAALEVEAETAVDADALPEVVDLDQRDVPPDEETKQQWIEELEEIDIDALTYDSDFTIFMKSWVPGPLRQRALRKLWGTNPALAVLDGLNDYDLDYTDKAMQAGKVVSSYIPGQGYANLEELAEKVAGLAGDENGAGEDDVPDFADEGDVAEAASADKDLPDEELKGEEPQEETEVKMAEKSASEAPSKS